MKQLTLIVFLAIAFISKAQIPSNDPHWSLLWEDQFSSFDNTKWVKAEYCDHGGEQQLYLPGNVTTAGGNLVITLNNNPTNCPSSPPVTSWICGSCQAGMHSFTSGWVESATAFDVQYGYIEARIKLPYSNGLWPAFWTWTNGVEEIDIFEMLPGSDEVCFETRADVTHDNNIMTSNIHMLTSDNSCADPYDSPSVLKIQDYTQWHTYAIEWSPSRIIWYIDGAIAKYFKNSLVVSPTSIIFNLAVQGGKTPATPAVMEVDYVKVYELNKDCDQFINAVNYPFSSYNNREKNFIKIGEGSGVNSLPIGQDVVLRASQYIDFAGDFTVPLGASLYADVNHECSSDLGLNCTQNFNPCNYNFASYNNSIKQVINLGSGTCNETINSTSTPVILQATNEIVLGSGVSINTASTTYSELKIVSCP